MFQDCFHINIAPINNEDLCCAGYAQKIVQVDAHNNLFAAAAYIFFVHYGDYH